MKSKFINTKTLFLSVLTIVFLFSSCEKDKSFTYRGRILSYGTLDPVPDAMVNIIAGKKIGLLEPTQEWVADSVRTDADGRFRVLVTDGDYHRIGKIRKEGYFSDLQSQVTSLFTSGPLANIDYIIDPKGVMHVLIERNEINGGEYCEITLPGRGYIQTTFSKLDEIYFLRASRYYKYYYNIDLNPLIIDSIYCKPFDTTYLHIKF